jgi:hypothetical protein
MSNFLFPESQQSWEDNNPINILPVSSNVVNIALTGAKSELQNFFASPTALEKLDRVFNITDPSAAHILIENSAAGIFEQIPHLQIVNDAAMNGAQGAFSQATNTIYLSDSLVRGDTLKVQEVLLEELGHKFDTLLNPGGDTSGDEGELFKQVVLGLPLSDPELLRIHTEDDAGTIIVDNQLIPVEQSYNSVVSSSPGFTKNRSGWTDNNTYPRLTGDVNGDGRADIVGLGETEVYVSFGNTNGTFGDPIASSPPLTRTLGGWTDNNNYPRVVGDVNGDGRADIVGFGDTFVFVSLGNTNGTFAAPIASFPGFTKNVGGWTDNNNYPRVVGDVNGDGRADIVGFGGREVYVSFGNTNGTFGAAIASSPGFTQSLGGWTDNNNYPRVVGDVNGDGRADIVGFGGREVYVSFGNTNGTFGAAIASSPGFTQSLGGWTDNNNYPRVVGDVNNDGKADLIGFGESDVFVSLY